MKNFLIIIFTFCVVNLFSQTISSSTISATGAGVWAPCGITSATIICIGGGGSGGVGGGSNGNAGGGGGGGGYTVNNGITIVPGTSYNYTVGAGGLCPGIVANGLPGGTTNMVIGASTISATGGGGGLVGPNGAGGSGGTGTFSGGNGAAGVDGAGGGGGEAASSAGAGNNASGSTGGTGTAGANGGAGNLGNFGSGTIGSAPGGGGGGATKNNCGGNGGNGQLIIMYTNPSNAGSNQTLANCATTANLAATAVPAGWSGAWSCTSNCAGVAVTTPSSTTSGVTGLNPGYTTTFSWVITYTSGCSITTTVNVTSPLGSPCNTVIPTNNACASAIPLTIGTATVGTTLNTTDDVTSGLTTGAPLNQTCAHDGNVWYSFTTPAGTLPCYTFQSSWNGGCNNLQIFKGTCATNTMVSANLSPNQYNDYSSTENTAANVFLPSTTYLISLGSDIQGPFSFSVKATSVAANDKCSGALPIGTTAYQTDNAAAGCEYTYVPAEDANVAITTVCAGSLENISWYGFTAVSSGTVTISLTNILCNNGGGGFQTGLITGSCSTYTVGTTGAAICLAAVSGDVTYNITNAVAGQKYLIAMDGNAGSDCHFAISGTNITPLPIELTMFNAKLNGNYIDLTWATASETNNDYFTIERSADGINFESIAVIKGAGNSLQEKYYYTQDKKPLNGLSYYRLMQTDFDKKHTYSVIQSISIDGIDKFDFVLYPNPSHENDDIRLQFYGKEDDMVNISITDIAGKILSEKQIKLNSSVTELELKHYFGAGIYFIKVSNKAGKTINQKFIVQ